MLMTWYPAVVFYFGMFDALLVMLGGAALSVVCLFGWKSEEVTRRVVPAGLFLITSNVVAAVILAVTRWWIS